MPVDYEIVAGQLRWGGKWWENHSRAASIGQQWWGSYGGVLMVGRQW